MPKKKLTRAQAFQKALQKWSDIIEGKLGVTDQSPAPPISGMTACRIRRKSGTPSVRRDIADESGDSVSVVQFLL